MASRLSQDDWSDVDATAMIDADREGNYHALMKALRTRIVVRMADKNIAARDLAALVSRLVDVSAEIDKHRYDAEAETEAAAPEPWDASLI